jgi:exosortase
MTAETPTAPSGIAGFRLDFQAVWRGLPHKGVFFALMAAWFALFHFFGNATFGYTKTSSMFGWLDFSYTVTPDDAHGKLIPVVVLVLFWLKRDELLALPKGHWWPAIVLVIFGLLLHVAGFKVQQTRISVVGFFAGLYGIMGLIWGPQWLRASFFPFCLFVFCLPLTPVAGPITFPLRLMATKITSLVCHTILGINVIQDGTRIFDANGTYQYDVAAACSGIRSMTAISALTTIYAFTNFKSPWRILLIMASTFPVAVAANVLRLVSIIVASETFTPAAGHYVHESSWISMLPYLPAIIGVFVLGHWLREDKQPSLQVSTPSISTAPQSP